LRASGLVDSRAAAILLRDYLGERCRKPPPDGFRREPLEMRLRVRWRRFFGLAKPGGRRRRTGWIEERLGRILGVPTRVHGSGRTDAGVHAPGTESFISTADWSMAPQS